MGESTFDFDDSELEQFIEEYMELDRRVKQPKGIYSILGGPRERKYQYTLQYFLAPQKPHGFGYSLLETFLNCLGFFEFNLTGQQVEIEDEVQIVDEGAEGRIDLIICGGSALADHPRWAIFMELKVGAEEGEGQLDKYDCTDRWDFNWYGSNELIVDDLDDKQYVYIKRDSADDPTEGTSFDSLAWSEIVENFEQQIQDSVFDYPNRSVIQFTDFIQSLKRTENMDPSIDADEINERLNVYFEHSDLIQQIEKANSQFENDFEDLSSYLVETWEQPLHDKYNFKDSDWITSVNTNAKWQRIHPKYWHQNPWDARSTILVYFRHSPTPSALRNRDLTFRLRLPPQRNVHTADLFKVDDDDDKSFNDIFTDKCSANKAKIKEELGLGDDVEIKFGGASALIEKSYQLEPPNLTDSYFQKLDRAVSEFCCNTDFIETMNSIFEDTYHQVFEEEPEGDPPEHLQRKQK